MAVTSNFTIHAHAPYHTVHTKRKMCVRTQQARFSLLYDKCPITPQNKSSISVLPTACAISEGYQMSRQYHQRETSMFRSVRKVRKETIIFVMSLRPSVCRPAGKLISIGRIFKLRSFKKICWEN
jgi:hypothetical protein